MPRTPLLNSLLRAFQFAERSTQANTPPVDELLERRATALASVSRRSFLKGAAGVAALGVGGRLLSACGPSVLTSSNARIVIVGAGLAGLNCAYQLQKAGVKSTIYEASTRVGGRIFTVRDLMGAGFTTELGGEFIDSTHEDMLSLASELQLTLLDTMPESSTLIHETYFFGGEHYEVKDAIEALKPAVAQLKADISRLPETITYHTGATVRDLDTTTLAQYIEKLRVPEWMKQLLSVAFVTEYGLDAGEQSALNMLTIFGTSERNLTSTGFDLFGSSDERYKIEGGNNLVTRELANRLEHQILLGRKLEAIEDLGTRYKLTLSESGKSEEVMADAVVMTIPFTMLRDVKMKLAVPPIKQRAIGELGYGTHSKLMIGMKRRVWQREGYAGYVFSDEPFQMGWDNTAMQPGETGGFTALLAGATGLDAKNGSPHELAQKMLPGLNRCYPGFAHWDTSRYERFHWPSYMFTRGSYACYRPGQWTSFGGSESEPIRNLFFAGEHTSAEFQGFMNGAAETGRKAAQSVLALLGQPAVTGALTGSKQNVHHE